MRPFPRSVSRTFGSLAVVALATSCAGPGRYVWYDAIPAQSTSPADDYLISVGDVISVRVLGHEEMTVRERVRVDGRIALPLIGEVEARGKRPGALRAEIQARVKDYIVNPSVTLNVDETQPMPIVVMGEVQRPGVYPLDPTAGIVQALAAGGGLTEYASRDRIFIVRRLPTPMRIRFTYDAVSRNENQAAAFPLHPGDMIVVE